MKGQVVLGHYVWEIFEKDLFFITPVKKYFFEFFYEAVCCGYSLEALWYSVEPLLMSTHNILFCRKIRNMFSCRNRKISVLFD